MTRNLVPRRYRGVSVAAVDVALTPEALGAHLLGREAYRRTEFVVARRAGDVAVARVSKASGDDLLSPIVSVEVLAGPEECVFVRAPEVDTGIASSLARVARERAPEARCVVVEGMYNHVSFILDPAPLRLRVVEVVPPRPPKLVDQVRRVLETSEDLPPIEVAPEVVDLEDLARARPARRYLFPCRGSGAVAGGVDVDYLDERPPRADWVLVGCHRSLELHRWFYGDEPPCVQMCPRELAGPSGDRTLTKCCLLESGLAERSDAVTIPWGATLEEVRRGIEVAAGAAEAAWARA
ncbi:MAG TPA: hypothetical protein VHK89_04270 [Actinomycetota bacterium]|nr:hypothetical protein [Actinomycetota bacterium]